MPSENGILCFELMSLFIEAAICWPQCSSVIGTGHSNFLTRSTQLILL
jgi:hypothetical protein